MFPTYRAISTVVKTEKNVGRIKYSLDAYAGKPITWNDTKRFHIILLL